MKRIRLMTLLLSCALLPVISQAAAPTGLVETLKAAGNFTTYLSLQEAAGFRDLGLQATLDGSKSTALDPNTYSATQGQRIETPQSGAAIAGATQGQLNLKQGTFSATQGQRIETPQSGAAIAGATQGQLNLKQGTFSATQGQHTFLVPTDDAFARLPAGAVEKLKADPDRLTAFLLLHSLPGRVMVSDMFENVQNSKKSFVSTQGHVLGFQCNGHTGMHYPQLSVIASAAEWINAPAQPVFSTAITKKVVAVPPQARISAFQDVAVAEGVVHGIDGVLLAADIDGTY